MGGGELHSGTPCTERTANVVAREQQPEGRFLVVPERPPLEDSTFTGTALSIRAPQTHGEDPQDQIQGARQWLGEAEAVDSLRTQ